MIPRPSERGAALLTVLMLVAVIATISATALDRLTVATRLAANAGMVVQGREWLGMAEQLGAARLEDLIAADPARTLTGPWLGQKRQIRLPGGSTIEVEVRDGGNCFNLNSLVRRQPDGSLVADATARAQFEALLGLLGVDRARGASLAAAASDWIDSDAVPLPGGAEGESYAGAGWAPSNTLFADVTELGAVRDVSPAQLGLLEPLLCALPEAAASMPNPNTMLPEQAPLLAMLAPTAISLGQAKALIASRPPGGFASTIAFWQSPVLAGATVPPEVAEQIKLRSRWFELRATVRQADQELGSVTLLDLRQPQARVVRRRYGEIR